MAYRMTRLSMTSSEAEGHFCCLSENTASFQYSVFTHKLETAIMARDLNFIIKVKDISRSQAVAYTEKVVISPKAFSSVIFRICGASRRPSASTQLVVFSNCGHTHLSRVQTHTHTKKLTDATDHPTHASDSAIVGKNGRL